MATHTGDEEREGFHPGGLALLLFALADFAAAVGVGSLVLGDGGTVWLFGAAGLLLAALAASG